MVLNEGGLLNKLFRLIGRKYWPIKLKIRLKNFSRDVLQFQLKEKEFIFQSSSGQVLAYIWLTIREILGENPWTGTRILGRGQIRTVWTRSSCSVISQKYRDRENNSWPINYGNVQQNHKSHYKYQIHSSDLLHDEGLGRFPKGSSELFSMIGWYSQLGSAI